MSNEKRDFGVEEDVPQESRHYGFWDMAAVWLGANCHPSCWWIGGVVAAAGFGVAVKANLISNPLAALFVSLVGYIGFKVGTTTIGLARVPLGIKGSNSLGVLNAISCIGWSGLSNFLAAITISYIAAALFGTPVYGEPGSFWIMIAGASLNGILSTIFVAVNGSRSIAVFEKILVVGLIFMSGWITVVVFRSYNMGDIMAWVPDASIKMPFGTAFDFLFTFAVTWVVTCCEFTRYAKKKSASTIAPALGITIAAWWFVLVGTLGTIAVVLTTGVFDPNMADPSSLAAGLGLGWVAFLVIIMSTVTTNLINIYVASYSIMAIDNRIKIKPMLWITGIACIFVSWIPIMIGDFYYAFSTFLGYVGAVLPPIGAIMIVDYYLIRKGNYDINKIGLKGGPYWYKNGTNWYGIVSWLGSSVIIYVMKAQGFGANYLGMILPGIFIAGAMYYVSAKIGIHNNAYKDVPSKLEEKAKEA